MSGLHPHNNERDPDTPAFKSKLIPKYRATKVAVVAILSVTAAQITPFGQWAIFGLFGHVLLLCVSIAFAYICYREDRIYNMPWWRALLGIVKYLFALWLAGALVMFLMSLR